MATRGGLESAKASGSIGDRSKNGSPGDASGEGGSGKNDRNNRGNKPSKAQENRAVADKPQKATPNVSVREEEDETFAERNERINRSMQYGRAGWGNAFGTFGPHNPAYKELTTRAGLESAKSRGSLDYQSPDRADGNRSGASDSGPHPRNRGSFLARGVRPSDPYSPVASRSVIEALSHPRNRGSALSRGVSITDYETYDSSVRQALSHPSFSYDSLPASVSSFQGKSGFTDALSSFTHDYLEENKRGFLGGLLDAALGVAGLERREPVFDINQTRPRDFFESYDFDAGDLFANALSVVAPPVGAVARLVNGAAGEPFKSSLSGAPAQREQSVGLLDALSAVAPFGGPRAKFGSDLINLAAAGGELTGLLDEDFDKLSIDQTGTQASGSTKQGVSASRTGDLPERGEGGVRRQVVRSRTGSAVSASASAAPGRTSFGLGVSRSTSANRGFLGLDEQVPLVERLYGRVR